MPRARASVAGWVLCAALAGAGCRQAPAPAAEERSAERHPSPAPAEAPPAAAHAEPLPPAPPIPPQAAVEVIDVATGDVLFTQRGDVLDRPTWMASIAKVFTLRAALDAGLVDADTRVPCAGRVTLGRRTLQCVHPPMPRPLSAVEAMAHSCNAFFTSLRLSPGAVAAAFGGAGLPAPPATMAEPRLAWVGLDGARVAPRRTLRAFASVVTAALRRGSPADRLLVEGLREAARAGTASAFAAAGVEALAKTGTASLGDGTYGGIVVALSPAWEPRHAVVALGAGIAGRDAAEIAAGALRAAREGSGVTGTSGEAPSEAAATAAAGQRSHEVRLGQVVGERYEVVRLPLEDYVAGVVAAEATPDVPDAARRALAIAARSYAVAMRGRHEPEGFDLCDLTHCQAQREPDAASRLAARDTAGQVLRHEDAVVAAFHHASCGGVLESAAAVWGGTAPRGVMEAGPDPAGPAHGDSWREDVSARGLLTALRAAGHRGDELRGLAVAARTVSGRVARLHLQGLVPAEIDGERFRLAVGRTLGWHVLKSSLYDVKRTARGYAFTGRGRGHGVGLCVAGAAHLAGHGADHREILSSYFKGAALETLPDGEWLRLYLPADREHERSAVEGMVRRQADAVRRATGTSLPATTLRFHESVKAYQEAAGQPWWTSGATLGATVHLLPLDVLRRRGLLDGTVRHELAHVVTAEALQGRPVWVKEGVARRLTGERSRGVGDPACPGDEEFHAAASAAHLRRIHDRALACVERAVAANGGDWRLVR